jgi:hypothetical protein
MVLRYLQPNVDEGVLGAGKMEEVGRVVGKAEADGSVIPGQET